MIISKYILAPKNTRATAILSNTEKYYYLKLAETIGRAGKQTAAAEQKIKKELKAEEISATEQSVYEEMVRRKALENSRSVLVTTVDEMMALSNAYAPEHLVIQTKDYEHLAEKVVNAGSVFLGPYACESAGDYASGTNHTLPTHGYATAYNGVNLDAYCRKITFQHLTPEGISHIGRSVELMAEAEQLDAHKNAMTVRIAKVKSE